jgi:hypothetical protein
VRLALLSNERLLKLAVDVGTVSAVVGAVVQWRIFSLLDGGSYRGTTVFIPMLGAAGINAPRTLGLIFFVCTALFALSFVTAAYFFIRRDKRG